MEEINSSSGIIILEPPKYILHNLRSGGSKPTSIQAWFNLQKTGKLGRQEAIVYYYIMAHSNCTRRQIEKETGISISSVCGRVNRLIEDNKITVKGVGICPVTQEKAELLVIE